MGAFTYPRTEPGSAGHMDLVERLNAHTAELRTALSAVPDAAAAERPAGGGWTIKEVLGHLCDVSHILHKRLSMMSRLEEPALHGYDAEALAQQRDARNAPLAGLLQEYSAQRAETVELLSNVVHWNWARTGRHPQLGRISIRQQVDLWIAHEEEHLAQLRTLATKT